MADCGTAEQQAAASDRSASRSARNAGFTQVQASLFLGGYLLAK